MIALRKRSKKKHLFHFRFGNFLEVNKKYQKAYAHSLSNSPKFTVHGIKWQESQFPAAGSCHLWNSKGIPFTH